MTSYRDDSVAASSRCRVAEMPSRVTIGQPVRATKPASPSSVTVRRRRHLRLSPASSKGDLRKYSCGLVAANADEFRPDRSSQYEDPVTDPKEQHVPQLVRAHNFTVSSDGFAAGEGQSAERPFGHANPGVLMAWAFATASFPGPNAGGGSQGLDDYFTREFPRNIGAEIMGRNKFGPQRGPWQDHEWQGWWGDEPPFHTPVFVMTHHLRPSFTLSDTTFHFTDGDPATVLEQAR